MTSCTRARPNEQTSEETRGNKRQRSTQNQSTDSVKTTDEQQLEQSIVTPITPPDSSHHNPIDFQQAANRRIAILNQLSPLYVPIKSEMPSLDASYDTLYEMLEKTLISHHNNACLLSGFSGSGKSSLIYSVISALQQKHALNNRHFVTVYLNGAMFINDTATLNEIIHQLSVDFEIDRPKEGSDFQTLLDFLYQMLATSRFVSTPIIFILDSFVTCESICTGFRSHQTQI
jgi:hypothetical protein